MLWNHIIYECWFDIKERKYEAVCTIYFFYYMYYNIKKINSVIEFLLSCQRYLNN